MEMKTLLLLTLSMVPVLGIPQQDGSFLDWIPSLSDVFLKNPFLSAPLDLLRMDIVNLTEDSASVSCSLDGPGPVNITWLVNDSPMEGEGDSSNKSMVTMVWEELGVKPGKEVFVTCYCQADKTDNSSTWVSLISMTEVVEVPGEKKSESGEAGSEDVEDEEVVDIGEGDDIEEDEELEQDDKYDRIEEGAKLGKDVETDDKKMEEDVK